MRKHIKLSQKDKNRARFIGVDLGDRFSHACVLDAAGDVVARERVATTPAAFERYFMAYAGVAVAIETGTHSTWVSRTLKQCGLSVVVANAREVRKIHQSHRKNDRSDAETLARMLRADVKLLAPITHRHPDRHADLAVVRARDVVVRARTKFINAVRGTVKTHGERLPNCSTHCFARRAAEAIPAPLQPALRPLLQMIETLTEQIRAYDQRIDALARERYPQTAAVAQVAGVGPLVSLTFVLTLDDPARFAHSRDVGPYLGLVPRQYDSGDYQSQLPITKAGNTYLRRLLVGSAQYVLGPFGPDCQLRRYGERLAQRGGKNAKKRAVVAVARKLAVLLHHLWSTGAVYDPLYRSQPSIAA
ncbi:MAG TPA: IS110 family transposase [Candidatus Tumulicola sp.]|nr:IS110 family transposase [Candidatus Tumulicola sp.]